MDDETFQQLYDGTAIGLRRYLRHVLGDRNVADEIAQEAYFRMLKAHLPAGMELAQQKSYLYRIATNLMHDQRSSRRLEQLPDGYEPSVAPALDQAHDVREAFGQLKVKERDLLWLAYVECFRHDEIAKLVHTTPGSVRPMLARAREKLRKLLGQDRLGETRER
jgi:RNA polymerase sigma-70 factor (ECF subfamily)